MFSAGSSAAKMAAEIAAQQRAKEKRLKEKYGDKLDEVKKKAKEMKQQKAKEAKEAKQQKAKERRHKLRHSLTFGHGGGGSNSTADESMSRSSITSFQDSLHETKRLPGGILKKKRLPPPKEIVDGGGGSSELYKNDGDGTSSITSDLSQSEKGEITSSLNRSNSNTLTISSSEHQCDPTIKNVSFDKIQIREFPQELGDNPSVSSGVPLCLGWEHIVERKQNLLLYEELRGVRRKRNSLVLSAPQRASILIDMGHTLEDIAFSTLEVERIKRDRAESLKNAQGWLGKIKAMDIVAGAAAQASGMFLGLARASSNESSSERLGSTSKPAFTRSNSR